MEAEILERDGSMVTVETKTGKVSERLIGKMLPPA